MHFDRGDFVCSYDSLLPVDEQFVIYLQCTLRFNGTQHEIGKYSNGNSSFDIWIKVAVDKLLFTKQNSLNLISKCAVSEEFTSHNSIEFLNKTVHFIFNLDSFVHIAEFCLAIFNWVCGWLSIADHTHSGQLVATIISEIEIILNWYSEVTRPRSSSAVLASSELTFLIKFVFFSYVWFLLLPFSCPSINSILVIINIFNIYSHLLCDRDRWKYGANCSSNFAFAEKINTHTKHTQTHVTRL